MDIGKLREAMDGDKIVFFPLDAVEDTASEVLKELASGEDRVVFLSVSKPAMTRRDELTDHGMTDENIFFIDGSKVEDEKIRAKNIVYVDPASLTSVSIALTQAVESLASEGPVIVMLDALESLGLYSDEDQFRRFLHTICNKMRQQEVPVVLMGSLDTLDEEMKSLIKQFADETYEG